MRASTEIRTGVAALLMAAAGCAFSAEGTSCDGAPLPYEGSDPPANGTGKFMTDMGRIAAAGWMDPSVGVVAWYGVAAEGSVKIAAARSGA